MVADATTALIPELLHIWTTSLNTLYQAMHSVLVFGLPLDNIVAIVIFLDVLVTLYIWRLR